MHNYMRTYRVQEDSGMEQDPGTRFSNGGVPERQI
jgi:hypothetical protein